MNRNFSKMCIVTSSGDHSAVAQQVISDVSVPDGCIVKVIDGFLSVIKR
jgi:hypothetical protein